MENANELELLQYRDKVIAELERRLLRLREVENELASVRFVLDSSIRSCRTLRGDTARIKVEEAHKAKLKNSLKQLESKRLEAQKDFERAEQRLKEVDQKIYEYVKSDEPV